MAKFDEELNYKLVVQGSVFHNLLENYKHHVISTKKEGNEIRTEIEVSVKDQAQLCGLLNMLYDFRYTILSIKILQNILD